MANYGIGFGAFVDGLSRGAALGQQMRNIKNRNEIDAIRKQGLASAELERENQITSQVKMLPAQDGLGEIQYQVGDQTFSSMGDARKAAGENVDSVMDLFMQNTAPKIREAYIAQGDIEKADSWENWVESRTGKAAIRAWTKGYVAAQRGDWDQAAKNFGSYYSKYIDGDSTYSGHSLVKDTSGNVTGFKMKLKDRKTGKISTMPMSIDNLIALGMMHNPQANFDSLYSQSLEADKARLADARDRRKFDREQGGKIELEEVKARLKDRSDQRKFDRNVDALRRAGYSDSFIQRAMPSLLGIDTSGPYRKGASPEETARMLHQERLKDFRYQSMTPEEQRKVIEQDMQTVMDTAAMFSRSGSQGAQTGQPQGQPVLDTRTNQIIYR